MARAVGQSARILKSEMKQMTAEDDAGPDDPRP
jgi:hypothetical protein